MRLCKKIALTSFMLCSLQSHAALVATDWKVAGDNLATLDTVSGLEWLDLTVTDGYSISKALSETGVGQRLEGWRLPTHKEVIAMLSRQLPHLDIQQNVRTSPPTMYGAEIPAVTEYRALFGTTYYVDSWGNGSWSAGTNGMYVNDNPDAPDIEGVVVANVLRTETHLVTHHNMYSINGGNSLHMTYSHANQAVFLVSDGGVTRSSLLDPTININNPAAPINQPVSVPGAVFGLGLFGMGLLLGRRRTR